MKRLKLKIPPLILMIVFGILSFFVSKFDPFIFGNFRLLPLFMGGVGGVISLWSVVIFKNEKTTVDPMNPNKSNNLVVNGVYKYSRNPMYLSFYLWLLAWSIYLSSPLSILFSLFFVLYLNIFQILPEEKVLIEKFGKSYKDYIESVRRWI
ncbi:MAG: protein-S-isoprenylcysteine methyltransferase [Halobacteriovorax sp.]|nr:protein-S-isoprenylcysteine methyltransferase [Halobacteriovorax sp.]|tara:strand:- start:68387 stop:68839 length:453 start_codon:yes stop_codon:yes gene_type:complete